MTDDPTPWFSTVTARTSRLIASIARAVRSVRVRIASDRLFYGAFLALSVAALVPLLLTRFLPLVDLPANTAAGAMMGPTIFGHGVLHEHFMMQWKPVPYWTTYLLTAFSVPIVGLLASAKLQVALAIIIVPAGLCRLLGTLGRDRKLGLLAFVLVYNHNLYWGWTAFLIGMGLVFFLMAALLDTSTYWQALKLVPLSVLIAVTHIQALQLLLVAGALLVFARPRLFRRVALHAIVLSGAMVAILPWLFQLFGGHQGVPFEAEWDAPATKVEALFRFTLGDIGPPDDRSPVVPLAFLGAILIPLAATLLKPRAGSGRDVAGLILLVTAIVFYMGLPMTIYSPMHHWYNYPRFAVVALWFLVLLPRPAIEGWRRAALLIPIAVLAVAVDVKVAKQFQTFGAATLPFTKVMNALGQNCRLVTLILEKGMPGIKSPWTIDQMHSYASAQNRCYDPHLFDNPGTPWIYRPERKLSAPAWDRGLDFRIDEHGRYYDYVIVQGLAQDPVREGTTPAGIRVTRILETGIWRVYKIDRLGTTSGT